MSIARFAYIALIGELLGCVLCYRCEGLSFQAVESCVLLTLHKPNGRSILELPEEDCISLPNCNLVDCNMQHYGGVDMYERY